MIDWAQVEELQAEMGDAFGELVDAFLQEVDEGLARLDAQAPPAEQAAALHFLKGSALNLGFSEFAGLCSQGELAANAGRSPAFDPEVILQCYQRSRGEFLTGLSRRAA